MNELKEAIVLHTRPYQNTSVIVDFFVKDEGLVRCVAKGQKRNSQVQKLNLFSEYYISYKGRSDLKTLFNYEASDIRFVLQGKYLYCGLYLNELLLRVLYPSDSQVDIYQDYIQTLNSLSLAEDGLGMEASLRCFEFRLLRHLGYLFDLSQDCFSGQPIKEDLNYGYYPENGFSRHHENAGSEQATFSSEFNGFQIVGKSLLAIGTEDYAHEGVRLDAKKLSRLVMAPYLGNKPLNSIKLFSKT